MASKQKAMLMLVVVVAATMIECEALKCYHCTDCPDSEKVLANKKECSHMTLPPFPNALDVFNLGSLGMGSGTMKGFLDDTFKVMGIAPKSCYKVEYKRDGKVFAVHRGCSNREADSPTRCNFLLGVEACSHLCDRDNCNGAPINSLSGISLITCVLVSLTVLL